MRGVIEAHWSRGRSFIARKLCELWDWRQANGAYKEFGCRDFLLRLEEAGHVTLPARKATKNNLKAQDYSRDPLHSEKPVCGPLKAQGSFSVRLCRTDYDSYLWDYLVHHHHYLGRKNALVGEHLKYLVELKEQVVACMGWASAAWKSAPRESFIGWTDVEKRARLHYVTNNTRFLVLPWVQVPHLASKTLGGVTRRLSSDWVERWGHPVVLAETFVDPSRFAGISYRAANWVRAGRTKGSGKRGASYYAHGCPKELYLYPLHRRFRKELRGC